MARRTYPPVRAVSCISLTPDGGKIMYLDDMTDEQRGYTGAKITESLLNAQFKGKAVFKFRDIPSGDGLFPQLKEFRGT